MNRKFLQLLFGVVLAIAILIGVDIKNTWADLFISDPNSVRRYDQVTGAFIDVFVSPGSGGLSGAQGITFGPDGNLYVASFGTEEILRYNGDTGAFIDVFVFTGSGGLGAPNDLSFGPDGHLYVADGFYGTNSILRYNGKTGDFIDIFATGGGIRQPASLTFGPDKNLFVGNATSSDVLRYHGDTGLPYPAAGNSGAIFVPGIQGPFNTELAFGPDGDLYVVSGFVNEVLRYNGTTGDFIGTFASTLGWTTDIIFGPDHNLFINNELNDSVSRHDGTSGDFIDFFVSPGSGGLWRPSGMTFYDGCVLDNKFQETTVTKGIAYYTDRSYKLTSVPDYYNNLPMIKTPNAEKFNSDANGYVTFKATHDTSVYVGFDQRATNLPDWMNDFVPVGDILGTSLLTQRNLRLFTKFYLEGECINLGGNYGPGSSSEYRSNYVVLYEPFDLCALDPRFNEVTVANGIKYYTDRDYRIIGGIPSWMVGRTLIQTPNDERKNRMGSGYIRFTTPVSWWVYVLFDSRSSSVPAWLNSWERYTKYPNIKTSLATQPGLKMYRKMFDAGQCVDLGGNYGPGSSGEIRSNYSVVYGK